MRRSELDVASRSARRNACRVKGHISRLLDKLEIDNRVQIALLVQKAGGQYRQQT
jgi:DNA-binding NarL/FixJ family response regulator